MTQAQAFPTRRLIAELTAKMLLEVEAVRFMQDKPFIFTSGWASPVYIDCRRLISFPRVRRTLIDFGAATVLRDAGFEQFDAVAGGETAGIPFAAWMADRLMLPMHYVRKKPKGFGRNAQIEGHLTEGQRVLLVEDLTTDGRSKVNFCNALREAGAKVEHMLRDVLLRHLPGGADDPVATSASRCMHSRTWWDVLAVAKASGKFDPAKLAEVEKFMHDPAGWSKAHGGVVGRRGGVNGCATAAAAPSVIPADAIARAGIHNHDLVRDRDNLSSWIPSSRPSAVPRNDARLWRRKSSARNPEWLNVADVIVVGGGNAAFCAALAAQEQGAKVVMLEAAPEDESGGNSRFTAGSMRVVYNGVDDIKTLVPDLTAAGDRRDRFRHLHGRPVLRRHGAGDAEPRRSRSGRAAGHQELRHVLLAARQGHPLHPDLRPAGVQDRRQVQVLGRAHGRGGRRRAGPRQDGDRGGDEARHRDPLRHAAR